jgi:DNA-binding SARP family transcriptional activator
MPDRLDILVLGPLEVRRGGEPLSLPGVKLRGLAALLTLRAGEVVSADALIDALWGEHPPTSARNALQVQVSGFRKLLAGDPIARLQTRGTGYVLELAPDQTDLARFARLVEEGRAALAASEHQSAREILGEALALWRGRPLEGLEIPGLPTAALADLEERHAAALSLRLEADLALGRHLDVLPELDGLRAEHPLDERVHALAALAYYRAGRQADALDVCASLRRTLSEELGIEPGPAIARLERQLLDQDPALDLAPPRRDDTVREARRTVTALVCRLTAARSGERLDPETQRAALGSAVEAAREVIAAHGGNVGQVIGGRIAAMFGIPQVHEDDPVRAVRAADELRSSSRVWDQPEGIRIEFRAAVATGEVLVRDIGDERSLLSVDPIEEADRLTQAARPGEVLLTPTTGRLARHAVEAAPVEIVLLGDGGPASSALRLGDVSDDVERGRRLSSPLVGRAAELAVLRLAFGRVTREAASSLVTVLGPAGVGKSRLAAEFLSSVGPDATILVGRCLPYGRDITFWPVAEMVRSAAGISLGEPAQVAAAKLTALLEGEPEADYIVEQILVILGLVDAFAPAEEVSWAVLRFLTARARTSPLIVVLEDLHWADATLLDLIEYVVEASRDAPLFVLCLARHELVQGRPSWGGGRLDGTNLTLGALDGDESSQLLDNLLGQAELDGATRRRIMEAAEGHPLFLEELLGMLIDEGILNWEEGRWVLVRDLSAFHLPPTVQALFDARLDRLSPGERATLEHAAIIGREFSEQDLRVLAEDTDGLETMLGQLVRRDFLELDRTTRTGRTYRFRHILLHDAVYEGMSKESRARDHEAFGSYLEGQAG